MASLSELIVFRVAAPAFFNGVLGLVLIHLGIDDLVRVQPECVQHILTVHHHIGQLFPHMAKVVICIAPLKALQQLAGFNGDGLCQVCRRVELLPVPFR